MNIVDKLFLLQDLKYKKFHSKLCPNNDNIIGVQVPVLKKLAKDLYKEDKNVLSKIGDKYYEEVMLQGLIISLSTVSVDKKLSLIEKFVPKIDNWAICDVFCSSLKIKKTEKEEYFKFLHRYISSYEEFEVRFLIVMLLMHFLEEEYLDDIFSIIDKIYKEKYYIKMAVAWFLSIAYIKYPTKTLNAIKPLKIDAWTYNKALQKIIESKRVNDSDKDIIRKMKK